MTDWLQIAADAYSSSTSYFDSAYRQKFEDAVAHFQSRHPANSKYNSDDFKHRSKIFRPKSRSMVRKSEAAAAAAFFSNVDVVSIEPLNEMDPRQVASAELLQEIVNFRLTDPKSIRWFVTCIGALQEAKVYGIVVSYQYWKYRTETVYEPIMADGMPLLDEETGEPMMQQSERVIEDRPCIELVPIENIRFDAGADWTDVVNTSPYLIRKIPMYVQDVRAMMDDPSRDSKGYARPWKQLDDAEIRACMVDYDSLRTQREANRPDPYAEAKPLGDFEVVWVHENFVRKDGADWHYFTLGTSELLCDPLELKEVYHTGMRPFVIGTSTLEAHRVVPDGDVTMGSQLQREVNDNANSRLDNVKLVLNKRWMVKRNTNVDLQSLMRNVPGAVTLTDDIAAVQEVNWPDVTSSAYAEQDRLNLDFDDLLGNFSQSSVMSNRQLNETVGGMKLLGSGANQIQEYSLRTFVETWVEPVIYQLVKLEQAYETDQRILAIAGQKAQFPHRYGVDPAQITDQMLDSEVMVRVNVGMGATDPNQKLQKLAMAMDMYGRFLQIPGVQPEELRKTIFGYSGMRTAMTAFKPAENQGPPPQVAAMMEQMKQAIQKLAQENQQLKSGAQGKMLDAQVKARDSQVRAQVDTANADKQAQAAIIAAQVAAQASERAKMIEAEIERYKADREAEARKYEAEMKAQSQIASQQISNAGANEARAQTQQPVTVVINKEQEEALEALQAQLAQLQAGIAALMQPERKEMRIQAPDGGVYEGVVIDGKMTIRAPDGSMYEGAVNDT